MKKLPAATRKWVNVRVDPNNTENMLKAAESDDNSLSDTFHMAHSYPSFI